MPDDANSTAGNYIVTKLLWSPSGNPLSIGSDGIPYMSLPAVGRQSATWREWITASGMYVVVTGAVDGITSTYYINNSAPTTVGTIPPQQAYTNILWEGPIVDDYASDSEGDALSWSLNSGAFPTGVTLQTVTINIGTPDQRTVQRYRGIPTAGQEGSYAPGLRATDVVGDFVNLTPFALPVGIGQLIPITSNLPFASGQASIAAALPTSQLDVVYELVAVPLGSISRTSPLENTYVPPGTPITIYVSGVSAPATLGLDLAAAVAAWTAVGAIITQEEVDSSETPGTIVAQQDTFGVDIVGGTTIPYGIAVTLQYSVISVNVIPDGFPSTLLQIVQAVCGDSGFASPGSVVNNNSQTSRMMLSLINKAGKALAKKPWEVLQREYSFTTTAGGAAYALPDDYGWFVNDTCWDRSEYWQQRGSLSAEEWQWYKSGIQSQTPRRRFRVYNQLLIIDPVPTAITTIVIEYVSKNWVRGTELPVPTLYDHFTADGQKSLISDHLLELDLTWRFLARKGLAYAEEKDEAERQIELAMAHDRPSNSVNLAGYNRFPWPPLPNHSINVIV